MYNDFSLKYVFELYRHIIQTGVQTLVIIIINTIH